MQTRIAQAQFTIKRMKKTILEAACASREGHVPSAFSVMDILWVLYDRILSFNPSDPDWEDRDRFILSKGHASLGLYAVLGEKGFFPADLLCDFGKFDSPFGGHPDHLKIPGVEASTGSLGHGFPMSVGIAMGLKIRKKPSKIFTLIGDGECNEGSVWESALLAAHHGLLNLCCIVDYNHSTDRALSVGNLTAKFTAFGWESRTIDGHDHDQIFDALIQTPQGRPTAVIAETVKGRGCKTIENNPAWHHRSPTQTELRSLLEELS